MRTALRRRHEQVTAVPERGTTLMELVVGMVLMTICGSIFTGAVVSLVRISNQTQAITDATSQNNRAFQTLDRTVRYAAAISTPGLGSATPKSWYVELRDTTSGKEVCTQLRIAGQQLQSRTWEVTPPTTPTAWTPIASGVTNGSAAAGRSTQPFYLLDAADQNATVNRQRLAFNLTSTSGPANQRSSSTSTFTLTALNSVDSTVTGPVCPQERP